MAEVPRALREQVRARAGARCEYCLIPERISLIEHEIDHIVALKHGGRAVPENLALSCSLCNKHKGSDIASVDPATGQVARLFDPRRDKWRDHSALKGGEVVARTAVGRTTARLLQWNRLERVKERELLVAAGLMHIADD
jgi:hypothetical protein